MKHSARLPQRAFLCLSLYLRACTNKVRSLPLIKSVHYDERHYLQRPTVNFPHPLLYLVPPAAFVLGLYWLLRCISMVKRLIFPDVRIRFAASADPVTVQLPRAGRYVISVVIPPMTFLIGVAHFSTRFSIATGPEATPVNYRAYGRALFTVDRSDMAGKQSLPLGAFECTAPGDFRVTCLNPDTIRANYQLEVSPHIATLNMLLVVLATIIASGMAIGGFVVSLITLAGQG